MINCSKHPDREAAGICISCGKPFCEECLAEVNEKNYCKTCLAETIENLSQQSSPSSKIAAKKKSTAILLWIFLGGIGAHRLYIGRTRTGLVMLLLWIVNIYTAVSSSFITFGSLNIDTYLAYLTSNPLAWVFLLAHGIWCFSDLVQLLSNLLTDNHGYNLI